jgi:hypothetical protein
MTVHVLFMSTRGIGSVDSPGLGTVRLREVVTVPGVTDGQAEEGEIVMVVNEEATSILVAHGLDPDASTLERTEASSAGFPVPAARYSMPIVTGRGDKVSIKAMA